MPGLAPELLAAFEEGEAFFNTDFDASGQSRRGGLGPLYNAASYAACHNGAGRGANSPAAGGLGSVLNPAATAGHAAEGRTLPAGRAISTTWTVMGFPDAQTGCTSHAAALANEMGVTSPVRPIDEGMRAAHLEANPAVTDISAADLAAITAFPRYTAVPARADTNSAAIRAGAKRFLDIGCESCHRATLVTGVVPKAPALSNQTIHRFTDLLLHDLGDGLADGRSDGAATGREWRTAPWWGLSLTGRVNRRVAYLHDGRARTTSCWRFWIRSSRYSVSCSFTNSVRPGSG